jgi:serine/threonine protein kinase
MVMEYYPHTLADYIEDQAPVEMLYKLENYFIVISLEIALAVQHVHSLGFIHRDIKPPNIMVILSNRFNH